MSWRDYIQKNGNVHSACVFEGDASLIQPEIEKFIEEVIGTKNISNPDVSFFNYESFGINDSRHLRKLQAGSPIGNSGRFFVLSVGSITNEAQNALLKIFEEPATGVHIFLIIPNSESLLPTLKSRVLHIKIKNDVKSNTNNDASTFIESDYASRLKIIQSIIKNKDRDMAIKLCNNIEEILSKGDFENNSEIVKFFNDFYNIKPFFYDRSPSYKYLLEYLALTTPKI